MKKILLLLVSALLLACTCSVPAGLVSGTPRPTVDPQPPNQPISRVGLTVTRLHPADGDLLMQLKAEAPKASALRQQMSVEFDATW